MPILLFPGFEQMEQVYISDLPEAWDNWLQKFKYPRLLQEVGDMSQQFSCQLSAETN